MLTIEVDRYSENILIEIINIFKEILVKNTKKPQNLQESERNSLHFEPLNVGKSRVCTQNEDSTKINKKVLVIF